MIVEFQKETNMLTKAENKKETGAIKQAVT